MFCQGFYIRFTFGSYLGLLELLLGLLELSVNIRFTFGSHSVHIRSTFGSHLGLLELPLGLVELSAHIRFAVGSHSVHIPFTFGSTLGLLELPLGLLELQMFQISGVVQKAREPQCMEYACHVVGMRREEGIEHLWSLRLFIMILMIIFRSHFDSRHLAHTIWHWHRRRRHHQYLCIKAKLDIKANQD